MHIRWRQYGHRAVDAMRRLNMPMHYKELFAAVCAPANIPETDGRTRNIENFRNHMQSAACHALLIKPGTGYFGIKNWYTNISKILIVEVPMIIDVNHALRGDAYHEAIERVPFMWNKHNDAFADRVNKVGSGLTAEKHVIDRFTKLYGDGVVLPDHDVKTPSDEDFMLKTPSKDICFDVKSFSAGTAALSVESSRLRPTNKTDSWIAVERLNRGDRFQIRGFADRHILNMHGHKSGGTIKVQLDNLIPPSSFMLFLNHCMVGIDCRKLPRHDDHK